METAAIRPSDHDLALRGLLHAWMEGGSAVPFVEKLIETGDRDQAIVVARGALENASAEDEARLVVLIEELVDWPPDWDAALEELSRDPSLERWRAMYRFASEASCYDWIRHALHKLRRMGIDPLVLFRFASTDAVLPDAVGYVEEGLVPPAVLIDCANEPGAATAIWLGLAAQATFLLGDHVGTIRLLREAEAAEDGTSIPDFSLLWLLARTDNDELREVLERMMERHR